MDEKTAMEVKSEKFPAGSTKKKVGFLERLSYANLDLSGQLVATAVNSYLMYFFTDVQ
ncbi:hypothetical protein YK48G_11760 [Lentilactobacillus fungorum]|uniref:MFS transporter n=1 Tax=Lentilactobacillus fungorum TaxID=2201250 RepID=A0ABQ3W0E9_9LACO|nr:hypothetical protein [Lentilactobacillus fungorum]GHP13751.1 hypothetical protein YK48G_11760 [Lentilactobacillus fungorum]